MPAGLVVRTTTIDGGLHSAFEIQPSDRYWQFQWIETGILLTGTLLLGTGTVVATRRRL
jgi:hypothetical protein